MITVVAIEKAGPQLVGHWLLPALGLLFGGIQILAGRLFRFWITGAIAVCAGFALGLLNPPRVPSIGVFFGVVGIVGILSGALVLFRLILKSSRSEA